MSDEQLEYLGNYFVSMFIHERYRITFQQFVEWMDSKPSGKLMEFLAKEGNNREYSVIR